MEQTIPPLQPVQQMPVKNNTKRNIIIAIAAVAIFFFCCAITIVLIIVIPSATKKSDIPLNTQSDTSTPTKAATVKRTYNASNFSYFTDKELTSLNISPLPKGATLQEEYKGFKFLKTPKKSFTEGQLVLLKRYIDLTPKKLLDLGPTAITTYDSSEVESGPTLNLNVLAFASGSYMFFNSKAFDPLSFFASADADEAYYTFIHEMTHIAQFNTIRDSIDSKAIENRVSWLSIVQDSELVTSFAKIADWQKSSSGKYTVNSSTKTSDYGKTLIYEDMAESVAGVVTTKDYIFSEARNKWALNFLGEDYEGLKKYKFPFAEKLALTRGQGIGGIPFNDYGKKNEYKSKYKYTDTVFFVNKESGAFATYYTELQNELNKRGFSGTLTSTKFQSDYKYYSGTFTGNNRTIYIELQDFGTQGTVILLLNGYN